MKEAVVILTLLGCDHDERNCAWIDAPERQYDTIALCETASDELLASSASAQYPVVMARCESVARNDGANTGPLSPDAVAAEIAAESAAAEQAETPESSADGVVQQVVAIRRLVTDPVTDVARTAADATVGAARTVITKTRDLVDAVNPF